MEEQQESSAMCLRELVRAKTTSSQGGALTGHRALLEAGPCSAPRAGELRAPSGPGASSPRVLRGWGGRGNRAEVLCAGRRALLLHLRRLTTQVKNATAPHTA